MARASNQPSKRATGADPSAPPVELTEDDLDAHVRWALAAWPQLDPEVEGIVTRIDKLDRFLHKAATASLARVGLMHEEFKVLIQLHQGPRSHGSLCRDLVISTGAMTNRLDKLENSGLLTRKRDPNDRRGVLLELTPDGREKLDAYVDIGAERERQLLRILDSTEKHQLNDLLRKLVIFVQSELGDAPGRPRAATVDAEDAQPA